MAEKYSWIPFYTAFADKLLAYRQNRRELLDKIQKVYASIGKEVQKLEEDNALQDIDPFTLFGFFNKGITDANRITIINGLIKEFDISANAPDNFNGIPVLNNLKANFFGFKKDRTDNDIDNLWELFSAAITLADSNTEENRNYFCKCYDKVHDQICIKWNITMGLYWIRPYRFLSLDSVNRNYVGKKKKLNDELSAHMLSIKNLPYGNEYMNLCDECMSLFNSGVSEIKSFPELTYSAWIESKTGIVDIPEENNDDPGVRYWLYAPGENARKWEQYYNDGIMGIGWHEIGDLDQYKSKSEIQSALKSKLGDNTSQSNSAHALWQFRHEIKIGDIIFVKRGTSEVLGRGIVESDYEYNSEYDQEYPNIRKVKWTHKGKWNIEEKFPLKTLTDITKYTDFTKKIIMLFDTDETDNNINTWLLAYSPKHYDWENAEKQHSFDTLLDNVRNGGSYIDSWRCASKKVKAGDRVFIIRLGDEPKGIIASGYAVGESFSGTYTDENGEKQLGSLINICVTKAVDYRAEQIISQKTLKEKFPEQQWSPQGSGIAVRPEAARWLIEYWDNLYSNKTKNTPVKDIEPYTKDDFLKEVYLDEAEYDKLSALVLGKKNIILQGAPGVGKTFAAKRLAYSIMGEQDDSRIKVVQFHQSYSYEDFIEGYRPVENGSLVLRDGIFKTFCKTASDDDKNRKYFFIIDEINRGNLSKIFGELLMLIEADKRDKYHAELVYSKESFTVPENVHIIGMMNTADRSLAMIDHALRRRFAFFKMKPAFDKKLFKEKIENTNNVLYKKTIEAVISLNKEIAEDSSLGDGFEIGHSYFCLDDDKINDTVVKNIIEFEIIPIIEEYWFDNKKKADDERSIFEALLKNGGKNVV